MNDQLKKKSAGTNLFLVYDMIEKRSNLELKILQGIMQNNYSTATPSIGLS